VHICKSYCEKISGAFFMWTCCIYIVCKTGPSYFKI